MTADLWKPFQEVTEDPVEWVRKWKSETNGIVVGHLLPDAPEEIIHASGALPFAVAGAGVTGNRAAAHIPAYTCAHAMGALEAGLNGSLDFLDGMVIPYVCDTTRNLFHVWSRCFPDKFNEFLRIPKRIGDPGAKIYLRAEFERFWISVTGLTGKTCDEDALKAGIDLYNRSRGCLREAYRLHRKNPSVWTMERVRLLTESAMRVPRDLHLQWMEALPWDASGNPDEKTEEKIPIYVKGKVWDPPEITALLDESGFTVVSDEIVTGFRSAAENAPYDEAPLDSLVTRHMNLAPYPGYHMEPKEIVDGFVDRVKRSGARGVLFLNPKFCEAAGFDTPDMEAALKEAGIPDLVLETSARGAPLGQIRVRLEAFGEILSREDFQ